MKPSLKVVSRNDVAMTTTSPSHANLNRALRVSRQLAVCVGKGVLKAMLYVVFLALMWLRGIVHFVTGACAGIGLLALVIAAFLAGWMYDGLLLAISPGSITLGERTAR